MATKPKIVRRPDYAGGGITADEKRRMDEHVALWIARAMRTDPIDLGKIGPAISALYAAAGRKQPRIVIVPSPLVMAFAGGAAAWIWYCRKSATHAATYAATHDATHAATRDATHAATDAATHAATRDATDAATRDATHAATDDATDAATRDATYAATRDATHAATRDATHDATGAATRDATHAATGAATRDATHAATDDATRDATYAATRDATHAATYAATRDATHAATHDATDAATRDATHAATHDATHDATRDATHAATYAATDDATRDAAIACQELAGQGGIACARNWWRLYQGGNMWSHWDCYLTAARDILGLRLPSHDKYAAWEQCAIHGGFRLMHEEFCMVSDFPRVLLKDAQNRPHCDDGPSHQWRDGWSIYHIHGVRVAEQIVMRPHTLTIEQIKAENNAEVRRVMIERYGEERYIIESGMRPVDHDEVFGTLYVEPQDAGAPVAKVRVINRSPEPDGSYRVYWLDINPAHYAGDAGRKSQAAVASTWRDGAGELAFADWRDYRPAVET